MISRLLQQRDKIYKLLSNYAKKLNWFLYYKNVLEHIGSLLDEDTLKDENKASKISSNLDKWEKKKIEFNLAPNDKGVLSINELIPIKDQLMKLARELNKRLLKNAKLKLDIFKEKGKETIVIHSFGFLNVSYFLKDRIKFEKNLKNRELANELFGATVEEIETLLKKEISKVDSQKRKK